MKILVIGSSHTIMIEEAWSKNISSQYPGLEIDFIQFTAPEISLANSYGWQVKGHNIYFSESLDLNEMKICIFPRDFNTVNVGAKAKRLPVW